MIKILFGLLLSIQIVLGQTEKLLKVSGTKCSLIPPAEFVASTTFSGFQNIQSGASIMIIEIPTNYTSILDGFTAAALKKNGINLVSKQTIDFNKKKAGMVEVTQLANGINFIKQILIFGDSDQTVMVQGIYPNTSKFIEPEIKKSLLSTVYNPAQIENPLDAVNFSIDTANTSFKSVKYLSGTLMFTTDEKIPTKMPTLIVGNSIRKNTILNQKEFAEQRLTKLPGGDKTIIKIINPISIDSLFGYEIIANGKTTENMSELIYQVMLFTPDNNYYIIVGQALEDFEKNLEIFKRVSKTFSRK